MHKRRYEFLIMYRSTVCPVILAETSSVMVSCGEAVQSIEKNMRQHIDDLCLFTGPNYSHVISPGSSNPVISTRIAESVTGKGVGYGNNQARR